MFHSLTLQQQQSQPRLSPFSSQIVADPRLLLLQGPSYAAIVHFANQQDRCMQHHFRPLMRLGQILNGARQAHIDLLVDQCQSTVARRSLDIVDLLLKH